MSCNYMWNSDSICYFCKGKKWNDITLADGRIVPICGLCDDIITQGKILAEKRGLFDPHKLQSNLTSSHKHITSSVEDVKYDTKGGERIIAQIELVPEKSGNGLPWLSGKTYRDNNIRHVIVDTEAKMVETQYKDGPIVLKPSCEVTTDSKDVPKCRWDMNKKTQDWMVKKFGSDSLKWIGEGVDIKLTGVGNMSSSIYPKDVSLENIVD